MTSARSSSAVLETVRRLCQKDSRIFHKTVAPKWLTMLFMTKWHHYLSVVRLLSLFQTLFSDPKIYQIQSPTSNTQRDAEQFYHFLNSAPSLIFVEIISSSWHYTLHSAFTPWHTHALSARMWFPLHTWFVENRKHTWKYNTFYTTKL